MAIPDHNANGHGAAVSLQAWAADAAAAVEIARQMVPTEFVPESLRVYEDDEKTILNYEATVQTVAMVLLAGSELGFPPMAAMRAVTIIKKTVGLYALAARALLVAEGHDIEIRESTSTRAIVDGRRNPGGEWQRSTWTIERATTARLYPGPMYGNWRTQTQSMLVARATAEACRWVAPDRLLALPVMVEEIDTGEGPPEVLAIGNAATEPGASPDAGGPVPPEEPRGTGRTAQRKRRPARGALPSGPASRSAPAPVPPVGPPPPPPPPEPRLTRTQRQRIIKGLEAIGKAGSAEQALEFVNTAIEEAAGHTVANTGELTGPEADLVLAAIDTLRKLTPADAQDAAAEAGEPAPPEDEGPDQEPPHSDEPGE